MTGQLAREPAQHPHPVGVPGRKPRGARAQQLDELGPTALAFGDPLEGVPRLGVQRQEAHELGPAFRGLAVAPEVVLEHPRELAEELHAAVGPRPRERRWASAAASRSCAPTASAASAISCHRSSSAGAQRPASNSASSTPKKSAVRARSAAISRQRVATSGWSSPRRGTSSASSVARAASWLACGSTARASSTICSTSSNGSPSRSANARRSASAAGSCCPAASRERAVSSSAAAPWRLPKRSQARATTR